jgi:flagella basal body P-ring formation protein FlgA
MMYLKLYIVVFLFCQFGITTAQSTFSGSRLKEAVLSHIQDRCLTECEIIVNTVQTQKFEESGVEASIVEDIPFFKGRMNVIIEFKKNSIVLRSLQVPVFVKLFSVLPTTATALPSGHILKESDIVDKKVEITAYKESEIVTKPEILGFRTIQALKQGAIITSSVLLSPESVRKGDVVTLIVQIGSVVIRGTAVALENGAVGDRIRITREGSQTVLTGTVQQNGVVLVTK